MAKRSAYGVHRLGAKIGDQFPAVLGNPQQHRGDAGELGGDPAEPDHDDRDPMIS